MTNVAQINNFSAQLGQLSLDPFWENKSRRPYRPAFARVERGTFTRVCVAVIPHDK